MMRDNDNLGPMLLALLEQSKFNDRNRKAFESRSGKLNKLDRQGATAGAIGTGVGALAALYGSTGGMGGMGGGEVAPTPGSAPSDYQGLGTGRNPWDYKG